MPIFFRLAALSLALTTTACAGMASFTAGGRSSASGGGGSAPAGGGGDSYASTGGGGGGGGGGGSSGPSAGAVKPGVPVTKFSDFAFEVKDSTGDYSRAWVIDKLTSFHVSDACMEKMIDKNNSALHSASFYTRDIVELAKTLTGDDWDYIEDQNSDKENNKKLIEPMIDAFKQNFGLSITVDGDDCDVRHGALWLKYWTSVGQAVRENPPASGKVFIQLAVRGDAKDVKVEVDDATSTYVITAPRDIEKVGWSDKIEKPFRKRARQK